MKSDARGGLIFALAGFSSLSVGDGILKTVAGEASMITAVLLRFAIGAAALCLLLLAKEGKAGFRPQSWPLQIARGSCLAMSSLFFVAGIFMMPLAEATALVFVAPIFTALLSGPLLGEKVRPAGWAATLVAFAGVLVILRPNMALLGWAAGLPLMAALFMSLVVITNRASAGHGSVLSMQALIALISALFLLGASFLFNGAGVAPLQFGWPDAGVWARCLLVACTASLAHWLIFIGTTKAGASSIAPTSYIQILVATFMGWWLFTHQPDWLTFIGAGIIILAGLYLWRDGRQLAAARVR